MYKVILWLKPPGANREDVLIEGQSLEQHNLDEVTLERQFVRPYREGRDIFLKGRKVPAFKVQRMQILYLPYDPDSRESRDSPYASLLESSADDVTDEVLNRESSTAASSKSESDAEANSLASGDQRSVFLVYGRWYEAVEAMREFLASLDLKIIEWEQAVQATGKASPYISEILDAGFKMAHAAVVLMTPDDVASLHPALRPSNAQPEPLTGQPRPNVIFEAGMAWQQFRTRTLLVEFGHVRGFSDLGGVHMVRLDGSPQTRRAIASRLKTIGCAVDDSGDRWLSAGRFPPHLPRPTAVDLGFETSKNVEARGVVAPADALRGIPLRWILLARLAEMHREQANSSSILTLNVAGIAEQAAVEAAIVKAVLADLVEEGLVEGFAESLGQTALDGACRITAQGLRRLRAEA